MIQKIKTAALTVAVAAVTAVPAFAESDAAVDAMFAAVDLSALKGQVATLLTATILIPLMFVGAALVKKGIRSARG